jgi:hypothetical protein
MSNRRELDRQAEGSKRTLTDMRLTRAPAETKRGQLHKLAARTFRAAREAKRLTKLDHAGVVELQVLARRGIDLLKNVHETSTEARGARLVARLCRDIDAAIDPITLIDVADVIALSEGLSLTLVELELAENANRKLAAELAGAKQDLEFERGNGALLRDQLAQAMSTVAQRELADERWSEPTRRSEITIEQKLILEDPDAG